MVAIACTNSAAVFLFEYVVCIKIFSVETHDVFSHSDSYLIMVTTRWLMSSILFLP